MRFKEAAHFDGLVEIELLVQVDHPVAVRADAFTHLRGRLGNQPDARPRIEGGALRGPAPRTGWTARIRQNVAVHSEHAIARRHRARRPLLERQRGRFRRRHEALRQTGGRVQLDVFARLTAEQLVERSTERLALDVPQREIDGAERVQPLLARRIEAVHERGLPDHLGIEGVAADDAAGDVANGVWRSALANAGDPGLGVDQDNHVALRKSLRPIPVVVRRVEDADLVIFAGGSRLARARREAGVPGADAGNDFLPSDSDPTTPEEISRSSCDPRFIRPPSVAANPHASCAAAFRRFDRQRPAEKRHHVRLEANRDASTTPNARSSSRAVLSLISPSARCATCRIACLYDVPREYRTGAVGSSA